MEKGIHHRLGKRVSLSEAVSRLSQVYEGFGRDLRFFGGREVSFNCFASLTEFKADVPTRYLSNAAAMLGAPV